MNGKYVGKDWNPANERSFFLENMRWNVAYSDSATGAEYGHMGIWQLRSNSEALMLWPTNRYSNEKLPKTREIQVPLRT